MWAAIQREKEIKWMGHAEKIALIESRNPEWHDLYETLIAPSPRQILPTG